MAMEYLVSEVKYLVAEIRLRKAEGDGECWKKELEFKMSYGDRRLKDNVVYSVEE
jgi:hypothetical protein